MTKFPNDIQQAEYYYSRYKQERDSEPGSESAKLETELGCLAYYISKCINEYNEKADRIAYTKRFWWWQWILTKRTVEKFKVKFIYRSQKAKEYYRKLLFKESKVKGERLGDVHKNNIIGYLAKMAEDDKTLGSYEHYMYIIRRLEELEK